MRRSAASQVDVRVSSGASYFGNTTGSSVTTTGSLRFLSGAGFGRDSGFPVAVIPPGRGGSLAMSPVGVVGICGGSGTTSSAGGGAGGVGAGGAGAGSGSGAGAMGAIGAAGASSGAGAIGASSWGASGADAGAMGSSTTGGATGGTGVDALGQYTIAPAPNASTTTPKTSMGTRRAASFPGAGPRNGPVPRPKRLATRGRGRGPLSSFEGSPGEPRRVALTPMAARSWIRSWAWLRPWVRAWLLP